MNRWTYDQFVIVSQLSVMACMCCSWYFSVPGELIVH